jgi:hypothetical protein
VVLEHGGTGGKLAELRADVEGYLDKVEAYRAAMRQLGSEADDEIPRPEPPNMPQALHWYIYCKEYHCLLVAGGLLDQPYWLWLQMEVAGEVYERILEARRLQQEAMAELQPNNRPW